MRTFSSFLLFEEVLDFAPQTDPRLYQFVRDVTYPRVRVLQSDCGTTVGTQIDVNYEIEGLIELATNAVINKVRIDALLSGGTYKIIVRDLFSCVTTAGICQRCFQGTYIDKAAPGLGTTVVLTPEYNYQTDVFYGHSGVTVFPLTESPDNYTKTLVLINGVIQMSGYTITGTTLTMAVAPSLGTNVVVKYYKITAQPFVGFLANSYSGSLLGMNPLPTQKLHIRPSLAQTLYSNEELNIMREQLNNYIAIPTDVLAYTDEIHDRLEKAIYISMLYGIFSNVNL